MYVIWIICKRVQDPIQGKSPKVLLHDNTEDSLTLPCLMIYAKLYPVWKSGRML